MKQFDKGNLILSTVLLLLLIACLRKERNRSYSIGGGGRSAYDTIINGNHYWHDLQRGTLLRWNPDDTFVQVGMLRARADAFPDWRKRRYIADLSNFNWNFFGDTLELVPTDKILIVKLAGRMFQVERGGKNCVELFKPQKVKTDSTVIINIPETKSLEFDGNRWYLTDSNGVRHQLPLHLNKKA